MTLKLGQRVTVLEGISHCKDEGSLQTTRRMGQGDSGIPRNHFVGKRGEIVQLGKDGPITCPPGCEKMVLVDSQIVNGKPQGACDMREWFLPSELEVG